MGDAERARIREVFGAAIELAPAERPSFIEHACAGDSALLEQVQSLLTALEDAGEYLGSPSIGALTAPGERPGALIGRYKLIEQIGEGGFGVVFLAEQREPVVRKVALKIIKLGMDTRQVIARFEAERQALAMMDHPNIARVLDAGATETGRPYFVMELVRGDTITAYCDRNKLTTRERLDLFTQVCQAVQHAHQKGVIHRDIKPSNVLIKVADGKPIPKVIDFGIAKATSARFTEKTLFTEHRALIGTPAYMSPEQAEMSGVDIDTRSDIYSLGVLLYELLTGTTPFDTKSLMAAGLAEIQRTIREVEPEKPSTRLSTLHAALPQGAQSAARRDIELGRRPESLRGDLDWIVMKALEKDRTRRYETANALAMEVERHLKNEPVLAGPPSRVYRFRKFAQRNRATVAAGALVAVALLAGMAGTTFGLVRAEQRRTEAEKRGIEAEQRRVEAEAARGREREQRELAEKREMETRQVSDFQAAMLSGIDVREMGRGIKERFRMQVQAALEHQYVGEPPDHRPRTAEEIEAEMAAFDQLTDAAHGVDVARGVMDEFVLARAADSLKKEFADQPLVQADLHFAIGIAYREIGLYGSAEPQLVAAMEIRQRELGEDDPDTLTSVSTTGYILWVQGKLDKAEPYYHRALNGRRRVLGNDDPATLGSINDMGELLVDQRPAEAKPYYDEALAGRRRLLGDDHPDTITSIHNMGFVLQALDKLDEAEPFYIEALERSRRVRGNEDPATLTSIHNMGFLLVAQGRLAEAEQFYLEALETARSVMGDDHPDLLSTINNLAGLLLSQDRLAEAETLYREALEKSRRLLGDDHPRTLGAIIGMGVLLQRQGNLPEAEVKFREGLETYRRVFGNENIETLTAMHNLGFVLQAQGHLEEGEQYYREALKTRQRVLGDEHEHTVISMHSMAILLQSQRKLEDADALFAKGTRGARAGLGDHPITAMIEHHHADVLRELERLGDAIELAQAAVDRYRAHPDWSPSEAAHARRVLAAALSAAGRQAEALEVQWDLVQTERQRRGMTPAGLASVLAKFAADASAAGDPAMLERAEQAARECLEIRQTVLPDGHPQVWLRYSVMSTLGQVLVAQAADPSLEVAARIERFREAEPLMIEAWENMKDDPNVPPPSATGGNRRQVALERIVRLYEAWHAAEPDKGYDSRAAEKRAELERL